MTDTPARPARLLLVDDDRLILGTLAQGLRHMGYEVHQAESAEDAEALLSSGLRPDMALLDVHMPGAGGLWLAQRLREIEHVPFVMLSAYGDASTVAQATRSGALAYLVKPLALTQIQPAIETALQRALEIGELRRTREQLQSALDGDRIINVATGLTMAQYKLPRQRAFELLRSAARAQRRKLIDVAQETVQAFDDAHA
ncbi:response regulator [Acidovorax sp. HDW3]|uniref:ANTAR domain-containing response regulator n=1 Tax=Acidovorax sp. HDW3 TaxID=2714923 RepID=UPI001408E3D2|nr:response regulator [Acidovorax sp. HDW3]QIL43198.1 response regulator [Acidovorax sp. HDW3]